MADSYVGYDAPSLTFGLRHEMPWLWNDWGIANHATVQREIVTLYNNKMAQEVLDHVIVVEPRLVTLPFENAHWIVMGCVSQFIFEDIEYFCTTHWQDRDPSYMDRQEILKAHNLGWIMAPSTLDRIEFELKEKVNGTVATQ